MILFVSLLLLQWVILNEGNLAAFIVSKISHFVGIFGVFLLGMFGTILSLLIIFKKKTAFLKEGVGDIISILKDFLVSEFSKTKSFLDFKNLKTFHKYIFKSKQAQQVGQDQSIKQVGAMAKMEKKYTIIKQNTLNNTLNQFIGKYDQDYKELNKNKNPIKIISKEEQFKIGLQHRLSLLKLTKDYSSLSEISEKFNINTLSQDYIRDILDRADFRDKEVACGANKNIILTKEEIEFLKSILDQYENQSIKDDVEVNVESKSLDAFNPIQKQDINSTLSDSQLQDCKLQSLNPAVDSKIQPKQAQFLQRDTQIYKSEDNMNMQQDIALKDISALEVQNEIIDEFIEQKIEQKEALVSSQEISEIQAEISSPLEVKSNVIIASEVESNKRLMEDFDNLSNKDILKKSKNLESNYQLPPLDLLNQPLSLENSIDEKEIDTKIQNLLKKLAVFKINGDIVRVYSGPIVTTFEFRPEANVKVNKILSLQDDLAMTLKVKNIRIEAPIPGKDVMGIEIPNLKSETIYLREILESNAFKNANSSLTIALGKDIVGNAFVSNLEKLPHLLVAGTTGSGKSVGVNAIILSLLYKNTPDMLKLIMIDPKKVEFGAYEDIPHLITPVINNPEKAILALASAAQEMDKRYSKLAYLKAKNIHSYNEKALNLGEDIMPFLVIAIDELADLIMTGGKDVEFSIARIAQMGRACGIHLIVATQRSSTDVVTGLIKTNLPSRISYKVGNRIDSKVILDQFGAERLLGNGDGLFTPPGGGLVRIHAPWVSEGEIEQIISFIKSQRDPQYNESFLGERKSGANAGEKFSDNDALLEEAKAIILQDNRTSISNLQRRLAIGYNKASLIIEALEEKGFLSAPNSKNERIILGS